MRRPLLCAILMLLLICCCFADTEWTSKTDTAILTAYKNAPAPIVVAEGTEVRIYNKYVPNDGQDTDGILGLERSFDINNENKSMLVSNYTKLNDALIVVVSTNSRNPVIVDVWFSAFRNIEEVGGDYIYSYITSKWEYASYNDVSASVTYEGQAYKYMLDLEKTATKVEAKNASGASVRLTFTPIAKQGDNVVDIPASISGNVLPGLDEEARISGTVSLSMAMGVSKYDLIPANTEYTATVRISIQGT